MLKPELMNVTFVNNTAFYGNNFGSYPYKLNVTLNPDLKVFSGKVLNKTKDIKVEVLDRDE